MIFQESKLITVYGWDLHTKIFIGSKQYMTEKGLGLPNGLTTDAATNISGKVAIRDTELNQWVHVKDDRGRVFYDKQNGQAFETTILGEQVDRRAFTQIAPPKVEKGQLLRFIDSQQSWQIGYDWYELPVWDSSQKMSYFTGDFFIPDEHFTNVEPMPHEAGFILDEQGKWIEPPVEPAPEIQE